MRYSFKAVATLSLDIGYELIPAVARCAGHVTLRTGYNGR